MMKKQPSKFISAILVLTMIITMLPITAMASELSTAKIKVDSATVSPGATVEIDVVLEENPGIFGAKLTLQYGNALTLLAATSGEAFLTTHTMTPPGAFTSPCNFLWDCVTLPAENIKDGTILSLTFEVSEDAPTGVAQEVSISYTKGNVIKEDYSDIDVTIENGVINVIDYIPGDLNSDINVNMADLGMMRKFLAGGYDIVVNEYAADVNADGLVNMADLGIFRKYLAGGYDIELAGGKPQCDHELAKTNEVLTTCTEDGNIEYWHCSECNKYFSDADGKNEISFEDTIIDSLGHTIVIDKAVDPTTTSTGLTEGSHCSVCGQTLVEQQVIPMLDSGEYAVVYMHIADDSQEYMDENKASIVTNNNPTVYTSDNGLAITEAPTAKGYKFLGWSDGRGGDPVLRFDIDAGETGTQYVYAHWELVEYKVQFDSPDVPIAAVTYTIDTGVTLENAEWYGYTFVGWSNDDGFIVDRVKPGTTGNITLHANWTSNRNRTTSYTSYDTPVIVEDGNNGQFVFVYSIGKIDNVPLSTIEYIGNSQTISISKEYQVTDTISQDSAETIANVISEATTQSSAWTLSEDWNSVYEAGSEYDEQRGTTEVRTDSEGTTVGGNIYVSNSNSGATYSSTNSGGSSFTSAKVTTDESVGINSNYQASTETDASVKTSISNETELSASVEAKYGVAKASAGVKNTTTIGAETENSRKDSTSTELDTDTYYGVGTVDYNESSSFVDTTVSNSSNWNSTNSYNESTEQSRNTEVSDTVSELISEKYSINASDSIGGENSTTESVGGTSGRSDEYSTTLQYSEGTSTTTSQSVTFNSDRPGYYRLVNAGTVHVFGVVGYDIATSSYYTYSYSILDDERHVYLDYSKDNANFDDCENGLVDFTIPIEVNDYITAMTGKSDGLEIGLDGYVTEYIGVSNTVTLPQYDSADNGDGTYDAVKVIGFDSNTFRGNTSIETVILPSYITEIPAYAFEGCTSLKSVIAYGVTEIGDHAFDGCTSLNKFTVDEYITSIGEKAFIGAPELYVTAADSSIADAAIASGAEKITLNITKSKDGYNNKTIDIHEDTELFAIIGDGSVCENLTLNSKATETFISNIVFANNTSTPLNLDSSIVTLNRVTVEDAPGFALILPSESTQVKLYSQVYLSSISDNVILCKNVNLGKLNQGVSSALNVDGNILICGEIENQSFLKAAGLTAIIDADTFNQYITPIEINFDANGGSVATTAMQFNYGQAYGELPIPERETYSFNGWYTQPSGGEKIDSDTIATDTQLSTLYAQWTLSQFTILLDANGGTVSPESINAVCESEIGALPTPTRTGYDFDGWYTEESGGLCITETYVPTIADDITVYAKWNAKKYTASWETGTGYSISVTRTSSPYVGASTGALSSGATIYYGDELTISYTASTGYNIATSGKTAITVSADVTSNSIYATSNVNNYTVSWGTGTGYSISVKRTSSPNAGASTGTLSSGNTIYYGDVLNVTYTASTGYSLASKGSTSVTVTGNVSSSSIYATATPNSYSYSVVYKSSNGTSLGTSTISKTFGTTNSVSAPSKSGYTTPSSQSIKWDATSKTITFVYTPTSVSSTTKTGTIDNSPKITYSATVAHRNRTENSVQICVDWDATLGKNYYTVYGQRFEASCGSVSTGTVQVNAFNTWKSSTSSDRTSSKTSSWITIPLSTTNATSIKLDVHYWQVNSNGTDMCANYGEPGLDTTWTISIPAY